MFSDFTVNRLHFETYFAFILTVQTYNSSRSPVFGPSYTFTTRTLNKTGTPSYSSKISAVVVVKCCKSSCAVWVIGNFSGGRVVIKKQLSKVIWQKAASPTCHPSASDAAYKRKKPMTIFLFFVKIQSPFIVTHSAWSCFFGVGLSIRLTFMRDMFYEKKEE